MELQQFMKDLNHKEYVDFRTRIRLKCEVSRTTIMFWCRGQYTPGTHYQEQINEVSKELFNKQVYDISI